MNSKKIKILMVWMIWQLNFVQSWSNQFINKKSPYQKNASHLSVDSDLILSKKFKNQIQNVSSELDLEVYGLIVLSKFSLKKRLLAGSTNISLIEDSLVSIIGSDALINVETYYINLKFKFKNFYYYFKIF